MAAAALQHAGQDGLHGMEAGCKIDLQRLLKIGRADPVVRAVDVLLLTEDEPIDLASLSQDSLRHPVDLERIG
jgi:hypothetical protein